ncbi:MAG: hypothetical protein KJ737_26910 [Proteobacteria bacterium]|nr:hypothetical protein [Pseudomonadota bacterium]
MIKSNQLNIPVLVLSMVFIFLSASQAREHIPSPSDQPGEVILVSTPQEPYLIGKSSQNMLKIAADKQKNNYAVRYYLGMTALKEGNTKEAIHLLEDYLKLAPMDEFSASVRERLTILKIDRAEQEAKRAAKGSLRKSAENNIDKNTVAVFTFNTGSPKMFHDLSKGLTAMIITDLTKVPGLNVLEREKVQAFIQEIVLSKSGITEKTGMQKTGKFLMASNVVHGILKDAVGENLDISANVTETLNGTSRGNPKANGPKVLFFQLEKQLVSEIIESLGIAKKDLSEHTWDAINHTHTQNYDAFICFSKGLDLMDNKRFAEARVQFEEAIIRDPSFDIAKEMLISVPRTISSVNEAIDLKLADIVGESDDMVEGYSIEPVNNNSRAITPTTIDKRVGTTDSITDKSQIKNIEGDSKLRINW